MQVSIVVPVFRSIETLAPLVEAIKIAMNDHFYEIVLVDDGNEDRVWREISRLVTSEECVRGIRLGRNVGQHGALLAGVRAAKMNVVVTIDDDLQNPPQDIPKLLVALTDGIDLVYGIPRQAAQPFWRRLGSAGIRHFIARFLNGANSAELSSFRAFRVDLRNAFAQSIGPDVSIDALLAWATDKIAYVEVRHHHRLSGESNYNFVKLTRFSIDMATGYSTRPLRLASALGAICIAGAIALATLNVVVALLGEQKVPGFATITVLLCLFSGVQLLSLGILGEYVARMHFRIMNKPTYHVVDEIEHK